MGVERIAASPASADERDLELTILMPCLNEAETLAACITNAKDYIARSGVSAEILIADNGSEDGSQDIAAAHGARVVSVPERGYGAALWEGIRSAQGRYVIMGDADASYDFARLDGFLLELRGGAKLVMGNRFAGGILPGAMPPLHRFLGNPVLSALGRVFFSIPIRDFHCGLRGFDRRAMLALDLKTRGMEFASEMVVRAAFANYEMAEVPTTLSRDGRSRSPHLRTWRDGWRHLRFLLIYSPRWMFLYPGLALVFAGIAGSILLLPGPVEVGQVAFDVHSFMVACIAILVGIQCISFAAIARRYAAASGLLPPSAQFATILDRVTLERVLMLALVVGIAAVAGLTWCGAQWVFVNLGPLEYAGLVRVLMLSLTALAIALQLVFSAFLGSLIQLGVDAGAPTRPQ